MRESERGRERENERENEREKEGERKRAREREREGRLRKKPRQRSERVCLVGISTRFMTVWSRRDFGHKSSTCQNGNEHQHTFLARSRLF